MIESLPDPGPRWLVESITPTLGIPLHPISLYYRDPLEAIRSLLCRPDLASSMTFAPRRVWIDEDKQTRVYSEIETGEWWWRNQVRDTSYIHTITNLFHPRSYWGLAQRLYQSYLEAIRPI